MKKIITLCLTALLCCGVCLSGSVVLAEGGRKQVDFTSSSVLTDNFDLYTEMANNGFFVSDGYLYSTGRAECKAILKSPTNLSNFTMEAEFHQLNRLSPLDAGFYVFASSPNNNIDGISAYNVQLEKATKSDVLYVRIHHFNQGYVGLVAGITMTVTEQSVKMQVVANNGNLKVYINDGETPVIDYDCTYWKTGQVGFRAFRGSMAKINNFKLYSNDIAVDKTELNSLISQAQSVDRTKYTSQSLQEMDSALSIAKNLSTTEQTYVDEAVKNLSTAIKDLVLIDSFDGLTKNISDAEAIIASGEGKYTYNTFNALKQSVERAKLITSSSTETEISEASYSIKRAIDNLIAYDF